MRYLKTVALGGMIWLFGFAILPVVSFAINSLIYPALLEWFPRTIPEYNFVNEREKYEQLALFLDVISTLVTIALVSYISIRFDNDRMEYMISKTDGMYTMRDGLKLYLKRNLLDDLVASAVVPLPFVYIGWRLIPQLVFLPESVVSLLNIPLEPTGIMVSAFGAVGAYAVIAAVFLVFRIVSGIRAIDVWRVVWLSDIQYVG